MGNFERHKNIALLCLPVLVVLGLFQNCAPSYKAAVQSSASTAPGLDVNQGVEPVLGAQLYEQKCSSCHQALPSSTLKGREITAEKINGATVLISAMAHLKNSMTSAQIDSLVALFTGNEPLPTVSSFACASPEAEKLNSIRLTRLTGRELQNTYKSLIPAEVWSQLGGFLYLLPKDSLDGDIANFKNSYTIEYIEQISRFNEELANQMVSSSSRISAFFGTCATPASFSKTCFDAFLTSKGGRIFRSALASDDNSRLWTTIVAATVASEQMKVAIQLVFNDPRFLYHLEIGTGAADANGLIKLSSYEVANRIAYGMTAAPPDAVLWADAVANKLTTVTEVSAHVDRIAQTDPFMERVIDFFKFYIGKSNAGNTVNHAEFLNGINPSGLDSAVTEEFADFIKFSVFTQRGTLQNLFTSQASFPKTPALAAIFGTSLTTGAAVTAPNHHGLLSRPYFNFVGNPSLKLVQRGRMIRMNMLCTDVPQPSATDISMRKDLSPTDLTTLNRRDYIDKATLQSSSCLLCHSKMNQMGYATEPFDSIGRFTVTERIYNASETKVAEFPALASSTPKITETDTRNFSNLRDFELALSQSNATHQCLSRKAFQFLNRTQDDATRDSCRLNRIDTILKQGQPLQSFFTEMFKTQSVLYKRSN